MGWFGNLFRGWTGGPTVPGAPPATMPDRPPTMQDSGAAMPVYGPPMPDRPAVVPPPPSGRFEQCLDLVLGHEGGLVDDLQDPGGITNWGISIKAAQGMGSLADVDHDGDVDRRDIILMQRDDAAAIYRARYWHALRCDELPAGIDMTVFDFGVNAGPGAAARMLQRALGVKDDGVIGPVTLASARAADPGATIDRMARLREQHYRSLRTFPRFGRGWLRRTEETRLASHRMAAA